MSRHQYKPTPADRRKGENALSDFADYVQKAQSQRDALQAANATAAATGSSPVATSKAATKPSVPTANGQAIISNKNHSTTTKAMTEDHAELSILDSLNLSDDLPRVRLKQVLTDTSPTSQDESIGQLKDLIHSRLDEGHGEALFDVGIEDNGDTMGLDKLEWDTAFKRVKEVSASLEAEVRVLMTRNVGGPEDVTNDVEKDGQQVKTDKEREREKVDKSFTGKVLIRRIPAEIDDVIETRIAVVGNVDAGKSTMLGVLVKGGLDDGRGKMRVNLFRHKHEMESGRTSSVGMEIMGFDAKGEVIQSTVPGRKLSWEEIGKRSAKVISFTDLAGHERYLRTTVFGLLSSEPNYCLLMVAANNGLIGMSKEHLGIALALNVPVMVVITKIDICPPQILQQTITQLTKILKSPGARKIPVFIKNREDCINTATQFTSHRICPVFTVSNVTGTNLHLLREFLNILPHHGSYNSTLPFEFHVNDTFSVPFVGTVVSGVVKNGQIHAGDPILIGPDSLGQFTPTTIRSIERKRLSVPMTSAGQSASFALKRIRRKEVRKGMVVLPPAPPPKVYREFTAEVLILSHATTIKVKYQAMLHVGPVSQTCAIVGIDRAFIRTGDRAIVAFRFVQRPEWLRVGDRILFREGRTKGLGIVRGLGWDRSVSLGQEESVIDADDERNKKMEDTTKGEEAKIVGASANAGAGGATKGGGGGGSGGVKINAEKADGSV